MASGRIRVFVSSTIRDLRDVRSALKFWLGSLDFDVVLSEYTDFDRRPDSGTFDACFEAIRTCDFYVLLIGGRAGSPFREGVSVTRQEFREARALAQQGGIVIIPFVRTEVQNAVSLHDDGEAARALGLTTTERDVTKANQEVQAIRSFIEEVKGTDVPGPVGGVGGKLWLYEFREFEDIVKALQITMRATSSVRRKVLLANLVAELEANLATLVMQYGGLPFPVTWFLSSVRYHLSVSNRDLELQLEIDTESAGRMSTFRLMGGGGAPRLLDAALQDALRSGEFLQFDRSSLQLIPSPELGGMNALATHIERCRSSALGLSQPPFSTIWEQLIVQLRSGMRSVQVAGIFPMFLFAFHDAIDNVLRLTIALHRWIRQEGEPFEMPRLHPSSPDPESANELEREIPSLPQLRSWLGYTAVCDLVTGLHSASPTEKAAALRAYPNLYGDRTTEGAAKLAEMYEMISNYTVIREQEGEAAAGDWFVVTMMGRL